MPPKGKHHGKPSPKGHRKHSHSPDHHKHRRRSKSRSKSRSRSPHHKHKHGKHHKKHGHESYDDQHWRELPGKAKQAARLLGYNRRSWDNDGDVPYDNKKFEELTYDEKRAAHFLGKDPIEDKLDCWWEEAADETKRHAEVLGWDEKKWDHDKTIYQIDCKKWEWGDMSDEQVEAMKYFGMSQAMWDDEGSEEPFELPADAPAPAEEEDDDEPEPEEESEEKKDGDDDEEEGGDAPPADADAGDAGGETKPVKKTRKKRKFTQTRYYGGQGGQDFNHGNNKHIDEISIFADGDVVHGLSVTYNNKTTKDGTCEDGAKSLKLRPNEYITSIKMKLKRISGKRNVTSIAFYTNRGTHIGPCGGDEGEEFEINAPGNMVLCGIMGRAGKRLDALAFRWGSIPDNN